MKILLSALGFIPKEKISENQKIIDEAGNKKEEILKKYL